MTFLLICLVNFHMIKQEGLRHRSYYTAKEYQLSLKDDLETLDDDEMDFVFQMFDDKFAQDMETIEYKTIPVDMETFLLDPYYLGIVGKTLFPAWLDDLIELFSGEYHEAIIGGAIGTGKSTFAHVAVIRMLYEASCLANPQASYGIMDGTPICFANVGVSKTNAEKVVYEGIASKLRLSEYFMNVYRPVNASKKEILFLDNIQITPGSSTESGIIGMNIFGGIMDESNFMDDRAKKGTKQNIALNMYAAIQRRMKSRFMQQGKLPGILMLISSKRTQDDFTEQRIRGAIGDKHVFVRDYSQWGTRKRSVFSPRSFKVLIGNDRLQSKIIKDDKEIEEIKSKSYDDEVHIIDVPEDYRLDFENDLTGAIRDIAGISTEAISNFLQNREKIFEMINKSRSHPFSVESFDMSKPGGFLWEKLCHKVYDEKDPKKFEWRPWLNPQAVRHIHIDPSLSTDSTGFAMGHISHMTEVIRKRRDEDGREVIYKEVAPFVVIDFVLEIVPPLGEEIMLGNVRQLVYDLSAHGFPIRLITMDSFQSADSKQQFMNKGYRAEILSLDISPEPYQNVKLAIYENRVDCYYYKKLIDELKTLEKDNTTGKVDHMATKSKDVSDAFGGVIHSLTTMVKYPAPPMERGISESTESDDEGDRWILQGRHAEFDKAGNKTELPLPFLKG